MALDTFKCNHLTPLHFKWLNLAWLHKTNGSACRVCTNILRFTYLLL